MAERNGTSSAPATGSIDALKDSVKHLVEQGQDKVGEIKTKIVDAKDKVVEQGGSFLASARSMIKDNPLIAVGVAFGIGYFAMRLFRR